MSHSESKAGDADRQPLTPEVAAALVDNHRAFLSFLQRRTGDVALAEDILQEAFVRTLDKAETLRDSEALVSWFYRVLRNAVVDHQRRRAAADRALSRLAQELEREEGAGEVHEAICRCVAELSATLKPEYADALRRVDIDGLAVKDYAGEAGISSNNAGVRLHRARQALRNQVRRSCGTCATHGCIECTCRGV